MRAPAGRDPAAAFWWDDLTEPQRHHVMKWLDNPGNRPSGRWRFDLVSWAFSFMPRPDDWFQYARPRAGVAP
jgi:hypothetical protein